MKAQRLRKCVLPLARVEHEQDLVRGRRVEARHHSFDLRELVHEAGGRVQASGRVGDDDVDVASARCKQGIVHHGRGVGAGGLSDHGHVGALAPLLELLHRGCTKGVRGGEQHGVSRGLETMGELADRRSLARAVDADCENHERLLDCAHVERRFHGLHERQRCLAQ